MTVVITGGNGFLGRRAARILAARGADVLRIDARAADDPDLPGSEVVGDVADPDFLARAVPDGTEAILHLAAVVSAQAEADYDLGMRVNVDGVMALIGRCRALPRPPRVVFASSVAVFGPVDGVVRDDAAARPLSSYGTEKAVGELLISDASRKGFLDGRCFRVPTISVRPGAPNKAASSFASSILREPLHGQRAVCPVDPATVMWLSSPRRAVEQLVAGLDLDGDAIGYPRIVNLPGLTVTVAEMIEGLARAGGDVAMIDHVPDPAVAAIVGSWPGAMRTDHADRLGFAADPDIDTLIRAYCEDDFDADAAARG